MNSITADEHIYYRDEKIVRRISHPAHIDEKEDSLVICMSMIHGKDTAYSVDEINDICLHLPQWDKTKYYKLDFGDKIEKYFYTGNLLLRKRRMPDYKDWKNTFIRIK